MVEIAVHAPATRVALDTVDTGLGDANDAFGLLADVRPLHAVATDGGTVVGGAVGRTWGDCCELQQLWVDPARRDRHLGSDLMAAFERAAAARGCTVVYLETFTFQAPRFYAALGYAELARIEGFGDGIARLTMRKTIAPAG